MDQNRTDMKIVRVLDQINIYFKLNEELHKLEVYDQKDRLIGDSPLPIPVTKEMDVEQIYEVASECGYNISLMIEEICSDAVYNKNAYDLWFCENTVIFYSPTSEAWVEEKIEGIFSWLKTYFTEEIELKEEDVFSHSYLDHVDGVVPIEDDEYIQNNFVEELTEEVEEDETVEVEEEEPFGHPVNLEEEQSANGALQVNDFDEDFLNPNHNHLENALEAVSTNYQVKEQYVDQNGYEEEDGYTEDVGYAEYPEEQGYEEDEEYQQGETYQEEIVEENNEEEPCLVQKENNEPQAQEPDDKEIAKYEAFMSGYQGDSDLIAEEQAKEAEIQEPVLNPLPEDLNIDKVVEDRVAKVLNSLGLEPTKLAELLKLQQMMENNLPVAPKLTKEEKLAIWNEAYLGIVNLPSEDPEKNKLIKLIKKVSIAIDGEVSSKDKLFNLEQSEIEDILNEYGIELPSEQVIHAGLYKAYLYLD